MLKFYKWLALRLSEAFVYVMFEIMKRDGSVFLGDPKETIPIIRRELWAIPETIVETLAWRRSEVDILTERLGRRYDVGMAINEATNRALEAKKIAKDQALGEVQGAVHQLSETQRKSMEFQKMMNQRIIDRA